MLRLDKEKAIALAFSRPSSLFVFIIICPQKLCRSLSLSNALHTRSATDIKAWELPSTAADRCQSAAPSEQSAVKHLAQGRLNRSCWRSKTACLIRFPCPDFPRSCGHEFAFWIFASGQMPYHFSSCHFAPVFFPRSKVILWCPLP